MREITKLMIKEFKINKLGFDMMGYTFKRKNDLSFHHLIVPRKECKKAKLGDGYIFENGAILTQNTSHDELHLIEHYDPELFFLITSELIDENIMRRIEMDNLRRIRDLLLHFEKEYVGKRNAKGHELIKEEFIKNRIKL